MDAVPRHLLNRLSASEQPMTASTPSGYDVRRQALNQRVIPPLPELHCERRRPPVRPTARTVQPHHSHAMIGRLRETGAACALWVVQQLASNSAPADLDRQARVAAASCQAGPMAAANRLRLLQPSKSIGHRTSGTSTCSSCCKASEAPREPQLDVYSPFC